MLDCELLRKAYINLLDIKEPKLVFSNNKIEKFNDDSPNLTEDYYKKVIKPSSEEMNKHKDFLKKELKKNYY